MYDRRICTSVLVGTCKHNENPVDDTCTHTPYNKHPRTLLYTTILGCTTRIRYSHFCSSICSPLCSLFFHLIIIITTFFSESINHSSTNIKVHFDLSYGSTVKSAMIPKSKAALITPIKWAIGSWSFFIAENVILSENRTYIINDVLNGNDDYYHYIYGLCSTTAVGSIIYAYIRKIQPFGSNVKYKDLLLWDAAALNAASRTASSLVPLHSRLLSFVTLSVGLGFISQTMPKFQIPLEYTGAGFGFGGGDTNSKSSSNSNSQLDGYGVGGVNASGNTASNVETQNSNSAKTSKWKVRCPFDFTDSKSKQNNHNGPITINDIHGMDRITRHPGLWSFGLIGLGSSFLSPCIPTRIYLTMPLVMALIGGYHNDSRFRRNIGGSLSKDMDEITSNVPFWALLSGKQGDDRVKLLSEFCREEVKGLNLVLSMGVAAMFVARKGRTGGIGGRLVYR